MLLKLFKSNHPSVIFLLPIIGVVLWIPALFQLPVDFNTVEVGSTTGVFNWLLSLFSFHPKAASIFALILVIVESFILIRLNFKYIFVESKTYLPAIFFVLLASVVSTYHILHPLLVANLFLLLALDKAFLFDKSKHHFKRYYESGLFLGLGTLFYPNLFVFVFIIWLTQFYLRTFNWREWFSSVLGILTPFTFYLSILFLTNNFEGVLQNLHTILVMPAGSIQLNEYSIIAFILLAVLSIFASLGGARVVGLKKISTRKYFTLFFLMALYSLVLFYLHPSLGYELSIVFAIPAAVIFTIYFNGIRTNWISEVIFTLFLLAVFVIIWIQ